MRVLPTPYHGIVDYSVGAMLVVSPWVVDFDKVTSVGVWIAVLGGAALMLSSAVTDYEGSILARWLTMPQHLVLDGLLALGLIATPFVFGFADNRDLCLAAIRRCGRDRARLVADHPARVAAGDRPPPRGARAGGACPGRRRHSRGWATCGPAAPDRRRGLGPAAGPTRPATGPPPRRVGGLE